MFGQLHITLPLALVLLLNLGQCGGQPPVITLTSTETTVKSGGTFQFNCSVTPYNADWSIEVMKKKFEVTMPGGKKTTVAGSWPYSIAKKKVLEPEMEKIQGEGERYTVFYSAIEQDNIAMVSVVVSATKPEDSGMWSCQVWKGGKVENIAESSINLQVDGPIRYVKIYAEATPGSTVPQNLTLSDGVSYTFMDGVATRVTCEVGVPSSTEPGVKVTITDNANSATDITKQFDETVKHSTSDPPKAGGLVRHTANIAKVNSKYTPNVSDHGSVFSCQATLQGYAGENASFTLNIESAPRMNCPSQIAAPLEATDIIIECTVMANPTVSEASWTIPEDVAHMKENATVTDKLTGITLKSTLTIAHVTKDHYGKYNITATNDHGTATRIITLTDRIVSAGTVPECSFAMATISSLILALILHR